MLARTISTTAAALLLALVSGTAPTAFAQDARAEARTQFNAGVSAFEAGNFEQALASFQEAYRLAPHPTVRVNMANCYERLNRPLEALFHFQRFLAESENAPPAQRREVQAAVQRLEGQIGNVTIRVLPDGALVRIDGQEVRRAPIPEVIRLMAGSHTVEVQLDGYQSIRREFIVEGGQPAEVNLRLERGVAPNPTVTSETTAGTVSGATGESTGAGDLGDGALTSDGTSGDMRGGLEHRGDDDGDGGDSGDSGGSSSTGGGFSLGTPTIIAGAVTGALLVGTIVLGSLALSANGDFDAAVDASNDPALTPADRALARQDGLDAKDRADTLALVTDVMLIGTILGAGATAFFLIQDLGASTEDEAPTAGLHMRLTAAATPNGAGAVLFGEF